MDIGYFPQLKTECENFEKAGQALLERINAYATSGAKIVPEHVTAVVQAATDGITEVLSG